jgi:hypothetical protein
MKAPGFNQPVTLSSDILVFKSLLFRFNLYRYSSGRTSDDAAAGRGPIGRSAATREMSAPTVGLYKLNSVDP